MKNFDIFNVRTIVIDQKMVIEYTKMHNVLKKDLPSTVEAEESN